MVYNLDYKVPSWGILRISEWQNVTWFHNLPDSICYTFVIRSQFLIIQKDLHFLIWIISSRKILNQHIFQKDSFRTLTIQMLSPRSFSSVDNELQMFIWPRTSLRLKTFQKQSKV